MKNPVIVFDFGGVLLDWNPRYLYRRLFEGDHAGMESFLAEISFAEWNVEQDKGRPFAEAIADLSQKFPHHAGLIAAYFDLWEESVAGPIVGTVEVLRQIKESGYRLFGLSNWSAETFHRIRPRYDFFNLFDGIVISGEIGMVKPDPGIYRVLLERAGESAESCLFIDDSPVNIAAAKELGFMTILFESPEQLRRDLSAKANAEIALGGSDRDSAIDRSDL